MPRYKAAERFPRKWAIIVTVAALFAGTERRKKSCARTTSLSYEACGKSGRSIPILNSFSII